MTRKLLALAAVFLLCAGLLANDGCVSSTAGVPLPDGKTIVFVEREEGAKLILAGPFFSVLSPLDVSLRLESRVDLEASTEKLDRLKDLYRDSVMDWTPEELDWLRRATAAAHEQCNKVLPDLVPQQWRFVKTSGREEGMACYTRSNCIFLSQSWLRRFMSRRDMDLGVHLIVHETYHVYSASHPEKRKALYEAIGFSRLEKPLELDEDIALRRITNPDADDCAWAFPVPQDNGEPVQAVLLILVPPDRDEIPGTFFDKMVWGFYPVRMANGRYTVVRDGDAFPSPINPGNIWAFIEPLDGLVDSAFLMHPDEIMAELVTRVVTEGVDGPFLSEPNRELLQRIETVLKQP